MQLNADINEVIIYISITTTHSNKKNILHEK